MEIISIEMTELTRRRRSLLLRHGDLVLDRPLRRGERVVFWDAITGDYHAGSVADVVGSPTEPAYRFLIGIRLPEALAHDLLVGSRGDHDLLSTGQVLDALERLQPDPELDGDETAPGARA